MLNLFSAVITQQDGQWWIYRPNDLELNGFTTFINQTTNISFLKNLNTSLGSQINNFYPHHCDANQQIEVKGAISAYRINYQYGFLGGIVANSTFVHSPEMIFNGWTTNPSLPTEDVSIISNPNSGLQILVIPNNSLVNILISDPISVLQNDFLNLRIKTSTLKSGGIYDSGKVRFIFKIATSDGYYLNQANQWSTSNSNFYFEVDSQKNSEMFFTNEIALPPIIADCEISISILCPLVYSSSSLEDDGTLTLKYSELQILDNQIQNQGIVGEFHTVSRLQPPSSITKENQKVFNGDGDRILIGSIYKDDLVTLTTFWSRKDKFENLPLLGISAMDDLRIQSNPIKVFSGSVFGEMPYMSVVSIDNVEGLFMPIEYNYDYKSNKSQVKLLQFYNTDIADIQYTISPDYGNSTIKPTIKG